MSNDPHSNKNGWRTPESILKGVRLLLGDDYFDPCPVNPDFDGLAPELRWGQHCFINCPYGAGHIEQWGKKGSLEYNFNQTEKAIWLLPYANSENRNTFKFHASYFVDFYSPRIAFINAETGEPESTSNIDVCLYLWGEHDPIQVKRAFGNIAEIFKSQ